VSNSVPNFNHETVLLMETVMSLQPHPGGFYIDCTLGGGGHTLEILRQSEPDGRVLCLDQDTDALENAEKVLKGFLGTRATLVHANFRNLGAVAEEHGFAAVQGIVFDLGVSSPQFDRAQRGFSYRLDAPLDMRMDMTAGISAGDIVNEWDEGQLADIFFRFGEEKFSRRIASKIVETRAQHYIGTTAELAELVKTAIPAATRRTGGHPAKRVFQALRIAVNDELGALAAGLEQAFERLTTGGRMAVISFHSLEDRMVKQQFANWAQGCTCPPDFPVCQCGRTARAKVVTRKPIVPSATEQERNSRSQSAKLRVVEKLDTN